MNTVTPSTVRSLRDTIARQTPGEPAGRFQAFRSRRALRNSHCAHWLTYGVEVLAHGLAQLDAVPLATQRHRGGPPGARSGPFKQSTGGGGLRARGGPRRPFIRAEGSPSGGTDSPNRRFMRKRTLLTWSATLAFSAMAAGSPGLRGRARGSGPAGKMRRSAPAAARRPPPASVGCF